MSRRTFTLRVDDKALDKMHCISKKNKRSVNNQIETLIDEFIAIYEKENGKIPLDPAE